jgi:hypothetical protein
MSLGASPTTRAVVLVAIGAATMGAILDCRQIAGITDDPPVALTSTACGVAYGTGACASCVNTNCCAASTACAASPACDAYQTCVGKCDGDPQCRSLCMIDDPGVAPEVSALDACLASNCEAQCGLTCGSLVTRLTPADAAAPCETCFQRENACDPVRACASSADCDEYARCFVACPTPDCREACASAHDAGAALFAPVQQVYANACSTACAYAENWNCVGHVVYPATNITTITETITLLDYSTGLPVPGVDVCLSSQCLTCGSPGQAFARGAPTDVNGFWKGTLQLPAIGAFGATQRSFQGCIRFSSPDIVPVWGFTGFSQTNAVWNVSPTYAATTVTPGELTSNEMAIEQPLDPSRALISMRVYDCLGTPAVGVQVASDTHDPQTSIWYSGMNTTTPASAANSNVTNNSGLAIFFGVPAPDAGGVNVTLTATPVGLGKHSSEESVSVQAGVITTVEMTPTP